MDAFGVQHYECFIGAGRQCIDQIGNNSGDFVAISAWDVVAIHSTPESLNGAVAEQEQSLGTNRNRSCVTLSH